MRRGELLGLMWGDIDLDRGTLRVERSVEETKAGLRLKPPKTKRGRRNLRLPNARFQHRRGRSLRHTHASMLINAGVDILTISRRLGHSKAAITLDTYGHLIGGADEAAAGAIEGVLK